MATKKVEKALTENEISLKSSEILESIKTVDKMISEIKKEIVEPIPEKIKDDEIFIPTKGLVKLKPTKLKYFKNGNYNNYMLIKTMGVLELLRYEDGEQLLLDYISAVLDVDKSTIDFIDDMSTRTLSDLIEKMNKINEIKDTDFLAQVQSLDVIPEE